VFAAAPVTFADVCLVGLLTLGGVAMRRYRSSHGAERPNPSPAQIGPNASSSRSRRGPGSYYELRRNGTRDMLATVTRCLACRNRFERNVHAASCQYTGSRAGSGADAGLSADTLR
jgi:hypothetical protein